ncbi:hypothetical protein J6590_046033 [Homalodisca vitripennis]|nr:hypothetical protein J6590_046033 [Homalodisca vitripennis]
MRIAAHVNKYTELLAVCVHGAVALKTQQVGDSFGTAHFTDDKSERVCSTVFAQLLVKHTSHSKLPVKTKYTGVFEIKASVSGVSTAARWGGSGRGRLVVGVGADRPVRGLRVKTAWDR